MSDGSLRTVHRDRLLRGSAEGSEMCARGPSATPQWRRGRREATGEGQKFVLQPGMSRAHAYVRTIRPPDIRGAAAQTLLMDVRTTTENERVEQDEDGREKEGLLTVCRLNVLGPLLNQLTYCLCGRQPLPCLHGTFLSTPPRAAAAAVVTPAHPAASGGLA